MLKEYTIFDIPIYLMSESSYESRIARQCERQSRECTKSDKDFQGVKYHCISETKSGFPWRYNQIVGSLRIIVTNDENIELKLYLIDEKKIKYRSKVKHMIKDSHISDLRIKNALTQYSTDKELKSRLNDLIEQTIRNYVNSSSHVYFVDMEIFDNLIQHINLRKLVMEMKQKRIQ